MSTKKKKIEDQTIDSTIQEIIEISRLTKSVKESAQPYTDKTRPIISSKGSRDELVLLHYTE